MKIRYFSSTHFENEPSSYGRDQARIVGADADVCVVAGDMFADLERSVRSLARLSERMPVVYVPGNIDFYTMGLDEPMEEILRRGKQAAKEIGNIHLLDNATVEIGDVRFIGSTMWPGLDIEAAAPHAHRMNDFRHIHTFSGNWTPERQNVEHVAAVDFVLDALALDDGMTSVVVTHSYPHPDTSPPQFAGSEINMFFVNDFDEIMRSDIAPDFWIHGTSPTTADVVIGKTRVICNGRGHYSNGGYENPDFDFAAAFETAPGPRPLPGRKP